MVLASDLRVCYFILLFQNISLCTSDLEWNARGHWGNKKIGERKYFYGLKREHPKAAWAMDLHDLAPRVGVY